MREPVKILLLTGVTLGLGLAFVAPVRADWLVTREGARVETKGPWKVQGKAIVFTAPNGTLSSLRASEVDLDLSALATSKAKEPPIARPAEKKRPVMVLTEKDHPPVLVSEADQAGEKAAGAQSPPGVEVVSWDQTLQPNDAGVELFGTLRNTGPDAAIGLTVAVEILDAAGRPLVASEAQVQDAVLQPGQTTTFRGAFPGLVHIEEARFTIRSSNYRARPAEGQASP